MSNATQPKTAMQQTPIAIIGLAGVFPESENLQSYWDNIVQEVDCISDVPASRWELDDYYDPDPKAPDKTYCKRGGFLPDIDFNPMEFGLPPNILEITDVSQLLSLVVAKQAMNDAGYANASADLRNNTGIILGVGGGQKLITPLVSRLQYPVWDRVLKSSGVGDEDRAKLIDKMKKAYIPWEENSFPGMLGNVIAGRVANRLDLGGTNCVVDAACAASLAAVKMAVSDLLEGRADMMITGGVDTDNSIFMYMSFSKTPAFSRNNDIRPFDEGADGMMIGEGVGMMVLKRLEDAERDGDRVYAVIKGIGTSSDGKYKSIYAPRASGQAKAVVRAYEDAGYDARTVTLVEAHGTGTPAGDPTEFAGLNEVFGHNNPKRGAIALGSVKSQIGHTKAAAGIASMIKISLALHHKLLPPTLKITAPNPKMDIDNSPFYLNTSTRPWIKSNGVPRRAGVSAFGFGGTNFHLALEEYGSEHNAAYRVQSTPQAIVLKAASAAALVASCQQQAAAIQADSKAFTALAEASRGIRIGQRESRLGFVADSAENAVTLLNQAAALLKAKPNADAWEHPKGIYYRQRGLATAGKVVALFPGQGSQYLNMGQSAAVNFPEIREAFGKVDGLFSAENKPTLSSSVYPVPRFTKAEQDAQTIQLRQTENAQPAIGTLSMGLYKVLQKAGFAPNFTAGHSFGELSALWAGGVLSDDDYRFLIKSRGEAMAAPNDPNFDAGTMLAVKGSVSQIEAEVSRLRDVTVANYNSTQQVVLAGSKSAIANAETQLKAKGYSVTPLPVSAAFHTRFVGHAQQPFARAIDRTTFNAPRIPVYANSTGAAHPRNPNAIKQALKQHILNPVYFKQQIETIYNAGGSIFIEIGPKRVLSNLVSDILKGRPHVTIAVNTSWRKDSDMQLRQAHVQMLVAGLPLQAIDNYAAPAPVVHVKKTPVNVALGGHNYVSPKTQKAYAAALVDGHTLANNGVVPVAMPAAAPVVRAKVNGKANGVAKVAPPPVLAVKPIKVAPPAIKVAPPVVKPIAPKPVVAAKPMVQTPAQSVAPPVPNLSQPVSTPPKKAAPAMTQPNSTIEAGLALLHQHQAETLRLHEEYLQTQAAYSQSVFDLLQGNAGSAPVSAAALVAHPVATPAPVAKQSTNGRSNGHAPVAPAPVAKSPAAPRPVAKAVVPPASNNGKANGKAAVAKSATVIKVAPVKVAPPPVPAPVVVAAPQASAPAAENAALSSSMLEIVSEKTGYPTEMLELGMDMESDLGIDSIKRVEILGAMQDKHPDLPQVNPNELAELRTLQEIVDHMQSAGGSVPVAAPVASAPVAAPAAENAALSSSMLEIVSEKTGYPTEMLELGMDMESDLGIDSIKRVEILGAMQDKHPDLPQVNPNELAELRTLQEIVDHMQSAGGSVPVAAPVAPAPVVMPAPAAENAALSSSMLEIVSEKTGYPTEMLELGMDMESDLGIDSIKRVEILGAMQDKHPDLPQVNPNELAELRTLQEIVDHMQSAGGGVSAAAPVAPAPAAENAALSSSMLEIVSEKTGYPTEMLELGMDMESDLGIDSIKRVEILGAMQDKHPDLPQVNPNELAELRTLQEIVDHMQSAGGSVPAAAPVAHAPVVVPAPAAENAALSSSMLEIVSEKTGYPTEMLELGMDMESDLGIDSIKRVEILGAMQDKHPDLPQVNPNELAELRTLQEIVDHMQSAGGGTPAAAPVAAPSANGASADVSALSSSMLDVVSEKTGYPTEMLELGMDMESDLGIDSIKRVEILGAMQDKHPDLPQVNPNELAELRTLQEIVDHLGGTEGKARRP